MPIIKCYNSNNFIFHHSSRNPLDLNITFKCREHKKISRLYCCQRKYVIWFRLPYFPPRRPMFSLWQAQRNPLPVPLQKGLLLRRRLPTQPLAHPQRNVHQSPAPRRRPPPPLRQLWFPLKRSQNLRLRHSLLLLVRMPEKALWYSPSYLHRGELESCGNRRCRTEWWQHAECVR